METIYSNNEVKIDIVPVDAMEAKVNVNDKNLMWISREEAPKFKKELQELLDKYRI